MADYAKTYNPTAWADDSDPSISASNLNKIEGYVQELDERTKDLKSTKEDRKLGRDGEAETSDYRKLSNKPRINYVELIGDLSLADLGIASASDLSALSDIVGQANAILEEV